MQTGKTNGTTNRPKKCEISGLRITQQLAEFRKLSPIFIKFFLVRMADRHSDMQWPDWPMSFLYPLNEGASYRP